MSNTQQSLDSDQAKRVSDADKEMEMRANRAKALLAERHVGLRQNQVCSRVSESESPDQRNEVIHNLDVFCYCRRLDNSARSSSRRV